MKAYLPLDSWYTITAIHEKIENFNCNIRFAKGYNLNVLIQNVHEKIKIGKNFAKGFNLKIHLQNVHEIEKISTKPNVY